MRKALKIVLFSLGSIVLLSLLFFGIWLTVNRWTRPLEPELWGEGELGIPVPPEESSWALIPKMRDQIPVALVDPAAAEYLFSALPDRVDSPGDSQRFWDEAGKKMSDLVRFLKENLSAWESYRKIIEGPPLIDQDPVAFRGENARVFYLQDLHELGISYVTERILAGDTETAFNFLFKMFQQDLSWSLSARSLLSQVVALHCLKADLNLMLLMRYREKPAHWEVAIPVLSQVDISKIGLRRALAYEYRLSLKMAQTAVPEMLRKSNWWIRACFNPSFIRRDLNQFYRRLETWAKRPSAISEKDVTGLDEEVRNTTRGPFWWFINPGGKLLYQMVTVNPLNSYKIFSQDREDTLQTVRKILNFQEEEKRPPAPESLPESHPVEPEEKAPIPASPPPSSPAAEE